MYVCMYTYCKYDCVRMHMCYRLYDLQFMDKIREVEAHDSEILCVEFSSPELGLERSGSGCVCSALVLSAHICAVVKCLLRTLLTCSFCSSRPFYIHVRTYVCVWEAC